MDNKEFANCVLWSLGDVITEYFRVPEVAAAFEMLINIKNGKSVIVDAHELKELRDLRLKVLNEPVGENNKPSEANDRQDNVMAEIFVASGHWKRKR